MRRFLLPAFLLALFFLAGRFCNELGVHADGNGVGAACAGNGDVNASGAIDISDAVYLLNWLFLGGPAPKACADGGCLTPEQEHILSHMSIVTPPETGGKETLRISGVNLQIVNGNGDPANVDGLGNLIVGYNGKRTAAEVAVVGPDDRSGSHNIVVGNGNNYTSFGGVVAGANNTISQNYACVSGGYENKADGFGASVSGGWKNKATGSLSSVGGGAENTATMGWEVLGDSFTKPRFVDNGDGTVADKQTGLMWQKATDPTRMTWLNAWSYCEKLDLAGHQDWRMPSIEELRSIVDETTSNPAIAPVFGAVSDWYWSSSSDLFGILCVNFYDRYVFYGSSDDLDYVRAVRFGP